LDECPSHLRRWEWYYLNGLRDRRPLVLEGHQREVRSVCFSPDGRRLASGSHDQTVRIWDLATGQLRHALRGHTGYVWAVAFSSTGRQLASASWDGTVRVWDASTGRASVIFRHAGPVNTVAFSPDGQRLASAGADRIVRIWDGTTGEEIATLQEHAEAIW